MTKAALFLVPLFIILYSLFWPSPTLAQQVSAPSLDIVKQKNGDLCDLLTPKELCDSTKSPEPEEYKIGVEPDFFARLLAELKCIFTTGGFCKVDYNLTHQFANQANLNSQVIIPTEIRATPYPKSEAVNENETQGNKDTDLVNQTIGTNNGYCGVTLPDEIKTQLPKDPNNALILDGEKIDSERSDNTKQTCLQYGRLSFPEGVNPYNQ